jgi:hypothetical protein
MKSIKVKSISFLLAVFCTLSLFACANPAPPVENVKTTQEVTGAGDANSGGENVTTPSTDEVSLPAATNPLTGLPCDEELEGKRPIAIMFNNLKASLPQIGLSQFDIIHEVLAEGGILRFVAVTQDYSEIEKIGSIRSARPYYVELSTVYDAIYIHAGGSEAGKEHIGKLGVNHIDALAYEGVTIEDIKTFYRDQERRNNGYAKEHTLFTSGEGIQKVVKKLKFRTDLKDQEFTAFSFDQEHSALNGSKNASYIKIPHSNYSVSEFKYNQTDKLYYHQQYGKEHIDGENNTKIATENVFVLFAEQKVNPDKTRVITLTGTGSGYYMADGKAVSITWKRESNSGGFTYFLEDGSELKVKCGKTYISIVDSKTAPSVTIS